jgi:acyl carrier protein
LLPSRKDGHSASCPGNLTRAGLHNFFIGRAAEFVFKPNAAPRAKIDMNAIEIDERFLNFSPQTLEAMREYHRSRDPQLVSTIVNGIVEKYLPPAMRDRAPEVMTSLNAFGIESVTLMEIILDIQDALGLVITDAELRSLSNFDQATKLLCDKVAALRAGTSGQS